MKIPITTVFVTILFFAIVPLASPLQKVDINQLINSEVKTRDAITVEGRRYYIASLNKYLDPKTLQFTSQPPPSKIFLDERGNLLREKEIIRKIGLIDAARSEQWGNYFEIKGLLQNIEEGKKSHEGIMQWDFFMKFFKTGAVALKNLFLGNKLEAVLSGVAIPFNLKPLIMLSVYQGFDDATTSLSIAFEIGKDSITEYKVAKKYFENFWLGQFAYMTPTFALANSVNNIGRSAENSFELFLKDMGKEFLWQFGKELALKQIKDEFSRILAKGGMQAAEILYKIYEGMLKYWPAYGGYIRERKNKEIWVKNTVEKGEFTKYTKYTIELGAAAPILGYTSPQIVSISPTQVQAGQFTLTINGSNFDSGVIDQLYTPSGQLMGSGVQFGGLVSRSSNQIVVRENLTGASAGTYAIKVKNSDGKISNPINIVVLGPSPPPPPPKDCSQYLGKGYCTDYIRTKVNIPWKGDAITWLEKAKENKYETGRIPRKGSISVFNYAMPFGHVAYVEEVSIDQKSFTVSHWNFSSNWINKDCGVTDQFGKITYTKFSTDNPNLLGFIYTTTPPPSPTVSMAPPSGSVGTTFTQTGKGFTPNNTATLHGRRPDGSVWQITTVNTDSSGAFSRTWTAQTAGNNFAWWGVDNATGKKSNEIVYHVTAPPVTNQPPNSPTNLSQMRASGAGIGVGASTNESTVVFKGMVSDPNNDTVKLQIELRRLDEYGGQFTGNFTKESSFVSSGGTATISVDGLINAHYHWKARAIDSKGATSQWGSFGGNPDSAADFIVSVGPPLPIISPTVSMAPPSGTVGTTFTQTGRGFTQNNQATLYGRRPDGSVWQITTVNTDSSGGFSRTWTAQTAGNNFAWWAMDNATGKKSNEIVYHVTAPTTGCIATVSSDRWKGEYFNNKSLSGTPLMVRDDGTGYLNFDWGNSSPSSTCGIPSDNFSARWTRAVYFEGGTYRFSVTADDGVRFYVDGSLKLDKWFDQPATTHAVDVSLSVGNHTIKMEYYESGGQAVAKLSWQKVTTDKPPVSPTISMSPPSGSVGTTFTETGSGFTPNNTATLHGRRPEGGVWQITTVNLSSTGGFSRTWTAQTPGNNFAWWGVDIATGKKSNEIVYNVTAPPVTNQPPNSPTNLSQMRASGAGIGVGASTNESTVVFKGMVSDPNNDTVKLQIELRRLDEYGGQFTGTHTQESPLVSSGSTANITVSGLINGSYHWRARTVDSQGATSPWLSAGGNPDSAADFIVSVGPPPPIISPTVTMSPSSGTVGTTFTQTGRGFTTNNQATLHGRRPDGSVWQITMVNTDSSGAFSRTWTAQTAGNNFAWWGVDNATGKKSNEIVYNVTQPTVTNLPPNPPTSLSQWRADGVSIGVGATTNQNTVALKGTVSDPINDTVKLQIELRRLDEYGGQFTGTHTQESPLVSSGSTANITVSGLINGSYHWRARTVDSQGATSPWLSAGGNPDSAADFIVSVGAPPPPPPPPPCTDGAQFVDDVTVRDNTQMQPNQGFMKTWRLKNTGSCTWGSGYSLVFVGGTQMGAPSSVSVPSVSPNGTVDLSVSMVAPSSSGTYQGNWQIRNPKGQTFGQQIWVKINVASAPPPPPPTCTDGAQFVADVTIPDGTQMQPNQGFTKTWRLKNTGSCSWGSGYSLVFVGGTQMGAPGSVSVPSVSANGTGDISVSMVAPSAPGAYQGNWQMRNPKGQSFGQQIWVKINVVSAPQPVINPQIQVSTSPSGPWGTSASGQQNTVFYIRGSGFSPNAAVQYNVRKPDGSMYPPGDFTGKVDGTGNFNHTYTSQCTTVVGTYTVWVIDNPSRKSSNTITELITKNPNCK